MKKRIALLLTAFCICLAAAARAADPIGVVIGIQGDAKALGADGAERTLSLKSPVFLKDTLRTGAGSKRS